MLTLGNKLVLKTKNNLPSCSVLAKWNILLCQHIVVRKTRFRVDQLFSQPAI